MPERNGSLEKYRFGFNEQERTDEVYGKGNLNTALFWEYDTRLGRRWNLAPVDQVSISNYAVNALNPIVNLDPNGDIAGDYYSKNGEHLGKDKLTDDKTYVADVVTKDNDGFVIAAENKKDLGISHKEFTNNAALIKHESGATGTQKTNLWLAHTINNALNEPQANLYKFKTTNQLCKSGYSSAPDKSIFIRTSDNSKGALWARAGLIDVEMGGEDPTSGAVLWDGMDFVSTFGSKKNVLGHPKFKQFSKIGAPKVMMDAMVAFWSIKSNAVYVNANRAILTSDFGNGFQQYNIGYSLGTKCLWEGQRCSVFRPKAYKSRLFGTGFHGGTIFWKIIK